MSQRPLVEVGKVYDYPRLQGTNRSPPMEPGPFMTGCRVVRIEGGDFIDHRGMKWNWETGMWRERR